MILTRKYQCYTCKHWGKINGYAGSCCITFDNNKDRTHMERIPKRSSCWCDGYESNGRKPRKGWTPFLRLGEYLTNRYGYNIVMAGSMTDFNTLWKITVESDKLKLPITIIFTFDGSGGHYSADDVIRILKGYEVKNKRAKQVHGNNLYGREYLAAVEMVKIHFNVNTEDNENEKE